MVVSPQIYKKHAIEVYGSSILHVCIAFRRLGNAVPARLTIDVQIWSFFCVLLHGNRFPW